MARTTGLGWPRPCMRWTPSCASRNTSSGVGTGNHSLSGREWSGSNAGRADLVTLLTALGLCVPTAGLSHRRADLLSIDHVALAAGAQEARRVVATEDGRRLSDHDLYVVVSAES
jgi:hypothetical protein